MTSFTPPVRRTLAYAGGFTLIEILAALAILGTSLLVLLNTHYRSLTLQVKTDSSVQMDTLILQALGRAEAEVQTGSAEGSGDFGKSYPECTYAYTASQMQEYQGIALYTVVVTVTTPDDSRMMTMMVYNTAMGTGGGGSANNGGLSKGNGSSNSGNNSNSNSNNSSSNSNNSSHNSSSSQNNSSSSHSSSGSRRNSSSSNSMFGKL